MHSQQDVRRMIDELTTDTVPSDKEYVLYTVEIVLFPSDTVTSVMDDSPTRLCLRVFQTIQWMNDPFRIHRFGAVHPHMSFDKNGAMHLYDQRRMYAVCQLGMSLESHERQERLERQCERVMECRTDAERDATYQEILTSLVTPEVSLYWGNCLMDLSGFDSTREKEKRILAQGLSPRATFDFLQRLQRAHPDMSTLQCAWFLIRNRLSHTVLSPVIWSVLCTHIFSNIGVDWSLGDYFNLNRRMISQDDITMMIRDMGGYVWDASIWLWRLMYLRTAVVTTVRTSRQMVTTHVSACLSHCDVVGLVTQYLWGASLEDALAALSHTDDDAAPRLFLQEQLTFLNRIWDERELGTSRMGMTHIILNYLGFGPYFPERKFERKFCNPHLSDEVF